MAGENNGGSAGGSDPGFIGAAGPLVPPTNQIMDMQISKLQEANILAGKTILDLKSKLDIANSEIKRQRENQLRSEGAQEVAESLFEKLFEKLLVD